jgi:hypothetical protein
MEPMASLITIGEKLITWLLDRHAKRSAQIDSYIKQIQMACRELMEMEDPRSDRASFIHEQLKVMYEMASSRLPASFMEAEGWNLYRALSSARIYYWLRIIERSQHQELDRLFNDRKNMSQSFEVLSRILFDATDGSTNSVVLSKLDIDRVRQACLNDIAKLSAIRPLSL